MEVTPAQHADFREGQRTLLGNAAQGAIRQHHHIIPGQCSGFGQRIPVFLLECFAFCSSSMYSSGKLCSARIGGGQQQNCRVEARHGTGLAHAFIITPIQHDILLTERHQIVSLLGRNGDHRAAQRLTNFFYRHHQFRCVA